MNNTPWQLPPKFKIYESLGVLGDPDRLEIVSDDGDEVETKIYSSSRNKFYTIKYRRSTAQIMANDNATWFVGYLGYPAITVLMHLGVIEFDQEIIPWLADIKWKDINQKYKNNFDKTKTEVDAIVVERGGDLNTLSAEIDKIYDQVIALNLKHLGDKVKPPKGY